MTVLEIFGKRIKDLRIERKLTQQAVADTLDIHRVTYYGYEAHRNEPSMENILKLAKFFGVSVNYLFGEDDVY